MKYFEVNNDNNHLQIDDTYMNLYMTRKIKLDNTSGTIQFQNGEIMAAIGNGTNSINGYCSNSSDHCDYYIDNAQNAYIYIFATSPQSSSTSGMQIFNEAGKLVFDSNQKQAKVIAVGTNSGTVVGSNIAIASGGLTKMSDLTVQIDSKIQWKPRYESVTKWEFVDGKFQPVTKMEWHDYYDVYIGRREVRNIYTNNVYINGGVISTKEFKKDEFDSGMKTLYNQLGVTYQDSLYYQVRYPAGFSYGINKSSGVISTYSYVVLDVNGL